MYLEHLYAKGHLGEQRTAVRRVHAAAKLLRDYERSQFVPRVNCALREIRGGFNTDANCGVLTGTDNYLMVSRSLGETFFVLRFFVIEDKTATEWLRCAGIQKASQKRIFGVYETIRFALDRLAAVYDEMEEKNGNGI